MTSCLHRYQHERRGERHAQHTSDEAVPVQVSSFSCQSEHYFGHVVFMHDISGIDDIVPNRVRQGLRFCFRCAGRKALEAPFWIGNALQTSIAVLDYCLLPALLGSLPSCPCFSSKVDNPIGIAGWFRGLLGRLLAVDQGLTGRQREEEDAHLERGHSAQLLFVVNGTMVQVVGDGLSHG